MAAITDGDKAFVPCLSSVATSASHGNIPIMNVRAPALLIGLARKSQSTNLRNRSRAPICLLCYTMRTATRGSPPDLCDIVPPSSRTCSGIHRSESVGREALGSGCADWWTPAQGRGDEGRSSTPQAPSNMLRMVLLLVPGRRLIQSVIASVAKQPSAAHLTLGCAAVLAMTIPGITSHSSGCLAGPAPFPRRRSSRSRSPRPHGASRRSPGRSTARVPSAAPRPPCHPPR